MSPNHKIKSLILSYKYNRQHQNSVIRNSERRLSLFGSVTKHTCLQEYRRRFKSFQAFTFCDDYFAVYLSCEIPHLYYNKYIYITKNMVRD